MLEHFQNCEKCFLTATQVIIKIFSKYEKDLQIIFMIFFKLVKIKEKFYSGSTIFKVFKKLIKIEKIFFFLTNQMLLNELSLLSTYFVTFFPVKSKSKKRK